MKEIIIIILIYFGVALMFIASLGLFRLPDTFIRMASVTKAVTFKIGLILFGAVIYFDIFIVTLKAFLIIVFLLLTTPVASHLIGREGYFKKVALWKKTLADEFAEYLSGEGDNFKPGKDEK